MDGGGCEDDGGGEEDEPGGTVTGTVGDGLPVCVVLSLLTKYVTSNATTTIPASALHNAIHRPRWDFDG